MKHEGIKVKAKKANKIHAFLAEAKLLNKKMRPLRGKDFVVFPLARKPNAGEGAEIKKIIQTQKQFDSFLVRQDFEARVTKPRSLRSALQGKMKKGEIEEVTRAFDSLGDIAVIEIPRGLGEKEKLIAEALMRAHPQIKTVLKKAGVRSGEFRVQGLKVIGGEKKFRAHYIEHGCKFVVDLDKVFFTPRLGTERGRIAGLIRKGETVSVLFAGVGPYAVVFAKHSQPDKIFAVELNPDAVRNMKANIELNKVQTVVVPVEGDVRKIAPTLLYGTSDRVVMPLPKTGEDFLQEALMCLKPEGGVVHFYTFGDVGKPYDAAVEAAKRACKAAGKKCEILRKAKCRSYSPETVQIVVDFSAK
ncbi:MAG: class I SAM-dependent methyltransferase family protein [Candidatus Diapherotrites archaeon]